MQNGRHTPTKYIVLTPAEERVVRCLALQKNGLSVSSVSRKLHLARTSIYNAVRSLAKKRLIAKNEFLYTLVSGTPILHERTRENPKKRTKELLAEILELQTGEVLYSVESDEEIKELFRSEKELLNWQKIIAAKGIVLKGIGSSDTLKFVRSLDDEMKREMKKRSGAARFTEDSIKGACVLVSFRNSVVFFSRVKNYFYRIDDAFVASFVQGLIDSFYETLRYQPIV